MGAGTSYWSWGSLGLSLGPVTHPYPRTSSQPLCGVQKPLCGFGGGEGEWSLLTSPLSLWGWDNHGTPFSGLVHGSLRTVRQEASVRVCVCGGVMECLNFPSSQEHGYGYGRS